MEIEGQALCQVQQQLCMGGAKASLGKGRQGRMWGARQQSLQLLAFVGAGLLGCGQLQTQGIRQGAQHLGHPLQRGAMAGIHTGLDGVLHVRLRLGVLPAIVQQPSAVSVDEGPGVVFAAVPLGLQLHIGLACAVQSLGQVHQGAQPQVMCKALHLCAVGQGAAEVFGGFIAQVLLQLLHQGLGLRLWCALLLAQIHLRHQAVAARLRLFALGLGGVAQP